MLILLIFLTCDIVQISSNYQRALLEQVKNNNILRQFLNVRKK